MLSNSEYFKEVVSKMTAEDQKTLIAKIKDWFEKIIDAIKEVMGRYDSKSAMYQLLAKDAETYQEFMEKWDDMIRDAAGNVAYTVDESNESEKTAFSEKAENDVITLSSTEEERYNILKDKALSPSARPDYNRLAEMTEYNSVDSENLKLNERYQLLKTLAQQFGVFKPYFNDDIQIGFEYSHNGLKESMNKQGGEKKQLAKLMSCLDDVIKNAIGIEVHNRNREGYKPNTDLKQVYVLASAFEDKGEVVPVKLEVKEYIKAKNNVLYLTVALESIKIDEVVTTKGTPKGDAHGARSSSISLASFFNKINKNDVNFLKYVPKQFFEQGTEVKFSLKSPVESVGDLVAIHNMHESDLIKTLKLGGFPMPSIAVMRADNAGQSYRNVNVL